MIDPAFCARCADSLRWEASGDIEARNRAVRFNSDRAYRLIIATIKNDEPAATQVEQEIGDCPACLRTLARALAGAFAMPMLAANGEEKAVAAIQHLLDEVHNPPDPPVG